MIAENRLEQSIIALFDRNLFLHLTINQIAKKLKKSYPYINKKVTEMIQEGIFKKSIIGKSHLCSLNLENEKTIILLTIKEIKKKDIVKKEFLENLNFMKNQIQINFSILYHNELIIVTEKKVENLPKNIALISNNEFKERLIKNDILPELIVVYGYERFFESLVENQDKLKARYSPL